MEVPEFSNGVIEIKSVAREAGSRCKVAVTSRQENVDPVGCCVGLRGIRIQNIVNELHGEKIDVVLWSADITTFIASALSPAQILSVESHKEENVATVVVPDRQLSLAIGREGQNVRLAAKLTGWRIDIKGASTAEAEEAARAEEAAIVSEEASAVLEPVLTSAETIAPTPPLDSTLLPPLVPMGTATAAKQPRLRFAEDIMVPGPSKPPSKSRKKQKKDIRDRDGEDGGRGRKARLELDTPLDEEEY
jgi:N utilization substance protein A